MLPEEERNISREINTVGVIVDSRLHLMLVVVTIKNVTAAVKWFTPPILMLTLK